MNRQKFSPLDGETSRKEFTLKFTDNINYKPYEYSNHVISLTPEKATEMFEKDLSEMIAFFDAYGLDADKAKAATEEIWRKHIVEF